MGKPARSAYGTAVAGGSASIYHRVDTEVRRRLVPMLQSERDCLESGFAKRKA